MLGTRINVRICVFDFTQLIYNIYKIRIGR